jgi:hypothetical protein
MPSPRALAGYLTKGTKVINVGVDASLSGSLVDFDAHRQGYNVLDDSLLADHISYKIRGNSGYTKTLDGRDLNDDVFDDSLALTSIGSTNPLERISSAPSLGGKKRLSKRLNHVVEQRDLGQTLSYVFYDPGNFQEIDDPNNGVHILQTHPMELLLPWGLVDHSSAAALDGVLEPLLARSSIDRSTPEFPFTSKGIRGWAGHSEDIYRNSVFIETGYNVPKNAGQTYDLSAQYYLDALETFEGTVELPPVFPVDERRIFPFADISNDREAYYARTKVDQEIASVLIANSTFDDDNVVQWDIMGRTGWIRAGNGSVDSVVYAGLLRG